MQEERSLKCLYWFFDGVISKEAIGAGFCFNSSFKNSGDRLSWILLMHAQEIKAADGPSAQLKWPNPEGNIHLRTLDFTAL